MSYFVFETGSYDLTTGALVDTNEMPFEFFEGVDDGILIPGETGGTTPDGNFIFQGTIEVAYQSATVSLPVYTVFAGPNPLFDVVGNPTQLPITLPATLPTVTAQPWTIGADYYNHFFAFEFDRFTGALAGLPDAGTILEIDGDSRFEAYDYSVLEIPALPTAHQYFAYQGTADIEGTLVPVFSNIPGNYVFYYPDLAGPPSGIPTTMPTINFGVPFALCFAAGSAIATRLGEVVVEVLNIGDMVLTVEGRAVPVKWIGRQTVSTRFGPAERLMPVRFKAGSLGEGIPHTDLTVTSDHAMLIDAVLCHAGALVNGSTITRVPLAEMGESFTVYHIETEAHEIILANGAPAETFIDNVSRRSFDNFAEFEALYGDVPEMVELDYPRAMSARQVPGRIRQRLAGNAAA